MATVERLSSLDELMLSVGTRWPQEVAALAILDGSGLLEASGDLRIEAVRAAIGSRLHLIPRFRQVVRVPRGLGGPVWIDAPAFDVADHVDVRPLPRGGGEGELLAAVERLRREPLDPGRPLWSLCFLPGLSDGRVALFAKMHHAIADGTAAMGIVATLLGHSPDVLLAPPPEWSPGPPPSRDDLRADRRARWRRRASAMVAALARPAPAVRRATTVWLAVRGLLAGEPSPATSLDRMAGLDRRLALIRMRIEQVKDVAHEHGATVNDVVLAATAGGLRSLLGARGELVDGLTVHVYVPVSLRASGGPPLGNRIAQMVVPLPVSLDDPDRLLGAIAVTTAERKARPAAPLGSVLGGRLVRKLMLRAAVRQRVNVTTANVRGPQEPLSVAGARVLELFPILPLIANQPIGVGAVSYAGSLAIGVVADRDAVPDVDVFVTGARRELEALGITTDRGGTDHDEDQGSRRLVVR